MTFTTQVDDWEWTASGSGNAFGIAEAVPDPLRIQACLFDPATGLITTPAYTVTAAADFGSGTVTFDAVPAAGLKVRAWRTAAATQGQPLPLYGPLPSGVLERTADLAAADRLALRRFIGQSVRVPDDEAGLGTLPRIVTRKGKMLAFDAVTGALVLSTLSLADMEGQGVLAAASAAAAAASAATATTQAGIATTQAATATTQAGIATTQATAAAASATTASTQAGIATAAAVAAVAAAALMPGAVTANAYLRGNGAGTAYIARTAAQVLDDLEAEIAVWTAKHTFQAGILQNTGFYSDTFTGSGAAANMAFNQTMTAAQAATPEIGMQVTLATNVGTANKTTAYKIAFTASVIGGANSANIYPINVIQQGYAGAGGYLLGGIESDVNNLGAHANVLGAATAAYGFQAVAAGNFDCTAGYWATASTNGQWTYGFATSNTNASSIQEADFYSESSATRVLYALGTHTTGVDFLSATLTYAMALKNNIPIIWQDSAAAIKNVLKLNASDQVEIGYSTGGVLALGSDQRQRFATDKNIQWRGNLTLANGASLTSVNDAADTVKDFEIVAANLYLNGALKTNYGAGGGVVSAGAADSGGAGFKLLRVPN